MASDNPTPKTANAVDCLSAILPIRQKLVICFYLGMQ